MIPIHTNQSLSSRSGLSLCIPLVIEQFWIERPHQTALMLHQELDVGRVALAVGRPAVVADGGFDQPGR